MTEQSSAPAETWNTLQPRLLHFTRDQRLEIDTAYQIAKSAHRGQMRDGGGRYFEHPRAIVLIIARRIKN